jgi:hypothetical protein
MANADAEAPRTLESAPQDTRAVDAWIGEKLGRRLIVVALTPSIRQGHGVKQAQGTGRGQGQEALARLCAGLAIYQEVRVALAEIAGSLAETLAAVAQLAPEVILVWVTEPSEAGQRWAREVLALCDEVGLLDRSFVALAGEGVTRRGARALGFEDGIGADTPLGEVVWLLAREAVAHDELRRGSSPPCYL